MTHITKFIEERGKEFDKLWREEIRPCGNNGTKVLYTLTTGYPRFKLFLSESIHLAIAEHNRVLGEEVGKITKITESYAPFQRIHYQSALSDAQDIISKSNK